MCGACHKVSVGQTRRPFKTHISEYRKCNVNNDTRSNYSKHLSLKKHNFDDIFQILQIENKRHKLNLFAMY